MCEPYHTDRGVIPPSWASREKVHPSIEADLTLTLVGRVPNIPPLFYSDSSAENSWQTIRIVWIVSVVPAELRNVEWKLPRGASAITETSE
jgi:hypothetical protein